MKTFITKTITFLLISTLCIGLLLFSTQFIINKKANFKFQKPIQNVIFGHSHPTYAFNDSLINNFKNLSQSRQSYLYSFIKIRNVISQNSSIKTIFLEFTNNQITEEMDDWIWDDMTLSNRLPSYLPFLKKEEVKLLYKNNPKAFIAGSSKSFRENIINIFSIKFDYNNKIGGYQWSNRQEVDSILEINTPSTFKSRKKANKLSLNNIEYLDKIINYCKTKNINIYLIRSPQHKKYKGRVNESDFEKVKNEKFRNIEFLDFNNFPFKNNEFTDLDHLNHLGATKFSKWFNGIIKEGLLTKKNKQHFIDDQIKKFKINDSIKK